MNRELLMRKRFKGFTLLELLLAIVILAVITAMVYGAFSGTVSSAGRSRIALEELRLRAFLLRSFETNFTTVYVDPQQSQEVYRFLGVNSDGSEGPQDTVRFCSTAPLIGGVALPGDVKEVRYEVVDTGASAMRLQWDEKEADQDVSAVLQVTETPLLAGNVQGVDASTASFVVDPAYTSPNWTVPVRTLNFQYFDGTQWLDEWDSQSTGRLPWAVWIKVNFAKTEEQLAYEREKGFSTVDDPDFEMIIPIRGGLGGRTDVRVQTNPTGSGTSTSQSSSQSQTTTGQSRN